MLHIICVGIQDFQRLRKDPSQQIEFGEFLELMDKLDLKVPCRH